MATVVDLGQKVKAKYPGQYDDLPDDEVGRRIKTKFPGSYDDFVDATQRTRTIHNDTAGKPPASVPVPGRGLPGDPPAFPESGIMGALHTPVRGVQQIYRGAKRMSNPGEGETRGGLADILQGGMKVASPYAVAPAVTNPVAALGALGGAEVGSSLGGVAADALDASPGTKELSQTVGGIVGGGVGAKYGPKVVDAAIPPIKTAASKVKSVATKPTTLKAAGTVTGAVLGHSTGMPYGGTAGAYIGNRAGAALSDYLNTPKVEPIPSEVLDRLGMTQGEFEELPADGQQQVRDLAGKMVNRPPMPPSTPGPVDIGPPTPKGKTLDDLLREDLESKRAQSTPMPPPGPPAPKQLAAGAIIPPAPADTSGVIPGWKPTILPNEKMAPPQAAPTMPPPGSPEPRASFLDQENTGMLHDKLIANRAAKANRFIDYLGGTQNFPRTQAEWTKVAADMGENVPSPETQAQIEAGLNKRMVAGTEVPKKVETIPAHLQKNPKALKIAQKLAESMTASQ